MDRPGDLIPDASRILLALATARNKADSEAALGPTSEDFGQVEVTP